MPAQIFGQGFQGGLNFRLILHLLQRRNDLDPSYLQGATYVAPGHVHTYIHTYITYTLHTSISLKYIDRIQDVRLECRALMNDDITNMAVHLRKLIGKEIIIWARKEYKIRFLRIRIVKRKKIDKLFVHIRS